MAKAELLILAGSIVLQGIKYFPFEKHP